MSQKIYYILKYTIYYTELSYDKNHIQLDQNDHSESKKEE